jgi:hypothetical protein
LKKLVSSFTRSLSVLTFLLVATNSFAQDQATIAKDSVQVTAWTYNSYKGNYDVWSWVPKIKFRVNGPIPSGSQLYVEFSLPTGPWVKFDCGTQETQKGRWWQPDECGGRDSIPEEKAITYTGPVNFAIKMRNELTGGPDVTLFTGKAKVGKVKSNEQGPKAVNKMVYYVDHDWNLPIGYMLLEPDYGTYNWKKPKLAFAIWSRGVTRGFYEPHLFHNGQEVGKQMYDGEWVAKPSCGSAEVENNPTHFTEPKDQFIWTRYKCVFQSVRGWDNSGEQPDTLFGPQYLLNEHPGDYEIKILYNGRLIRSIKFSVNAEGKFVDNGIANNNKLGNDRIIVPVQVLGDSDGPWDRNAWKTEAFYGNPLTGFTVGP